MYSKGVGDGIGKHEMQYISMLGNLQRVNLLGKFTYIEFGAGKLHVVIGMAVLVLVSNVQQSKVTIR